MSKSSKYRLDTIAAKLDARERLRRLQSGAKDVVGTAKHLIRTNPGPIGQSDASSELKQQLAKVGHLASSGVRTASTVGRASALGLATAARGLTFHLPAQKEKLSKLQHDIENQGGHYRELIKNRRLLDSAFVGGESLGSLLTASHIPTEIIQAYEAAFPTMAQSISFQEKVRTLDDSSLAGLLSAVKGKLFEIQYVNFLNAGNLPDGYEAVLATRANQPGWDIEIYGSNDEIVSVIQAKATDSVSYVMEAIRNYPGIDVVTTDEVYGHLVLSGISEGITSSSLRNADISDSIGAAADSASIALSFTPPWFTLGLIAFTSYREDSLTAYRRLELAGNRSGKAYLAYLIGGGVAAITNTWWIGVLASVSSRYLSDRGLRHARVFDQLNTTYRSNRRIIQRLKSGTGQDTSTHQGTRIV